jgi:hypothetical protein
MSRYKVDVPPGQSGNWNVERFEVSQLTAEISCLRSSSRSVSPGQYTRLTRGRAVIMSDTPAEVSDHLPFIRRARRVGGKILIHGLGLGVCLDAILREDMRPTNVEHVLVIEKSQDVIGLVAQHYLDRYGDRLEIRQGDAYTWQPEKGQRWTCVWHDIWDNLCLDNLPKTTKLHRRFGRRCDWQDSWGRTYLKIRKRREDKEARRMQWRF